jgi:cell division protein ZapA
MNLTNSMGMKALPHKEETGVTSNDRNRLTVQIYGQLYRLVGKESDQHMKRVARYVDETMKDFSLGNPRLDTTKLAVLSAVNIADEYFKLKEEHDHLLRLLDDQTKSK